MLNVPAQAFPAPGSQQRVAEAGRKKIPLKPGRSLMDWIRLTKSGKDLTGLRGRLVEVTEEELARHSKKEDCWICIRGLVYNVTPYMEYHPGGEDELLKAAGADGTDLFDQVHRWVNYESMLKECLVGRMAVKPAAVNKDANSRIRKEKEMVNGELPNKLSESFAKDFCPRYDWFQTDLVVTIAIYSKQKDMESELVTVDHEDGILRVEIVIKDYSYLLHFELSHEVKEDIVVFVSGTVGKVEIVMKKKDSISWKKLGRSLDDHNSFIKSTERELFYRKCSLVSKTRVTHNTKLFCLMLPHCAHLMVPVGQHVYLKHTIAGTEIVKPYTPVSQALLDSKEFLLRDNKYIYLMIKVYPNGEFTQEIDKLQIGDNLFVSSPQGNFRKSLLQEVKDLFLLAAGTGFTPMVKLLRNTSSFRKIKLMFFNRTEDDILWKEQLEQLACTDKRFEVQFVLSEPTDEWTGKRGNISLDVLSEFLKRSHEKLRTLVCICGPTTFTEQGISQPTRIDFCKGMEVHS
ncbi:cytochrome b5 reductase 4 isoform X2 [Rhinatrema bivittatum]|uniref:cytochrome b5 reductase 4 isoform X2 n=1 Tax=Rhinatrema bivittatum TaxID=194408 RepID=UPI00112617C5|nr:cytochrome b5 reductase 4 isoform X2 [Rhinatrema bivittatum]